MKKTTLFCLLLMLSCSSEVGTPQPTAIDKNRKRGCMSVTEINWAGSVSDTGVYDPDDDFIELENRDCNVPVDLTGWLIKLYGDAERIFVVPAGPNNIVQPNGRAVLIARANGAFAADPARGYRPIHVPGMFFPNRHWTLETKTAEDFLIENEMNTMEGEPLAGGYDGYTSRSMERTADQFDEEGTQASSWHSYTPCNEALPGSGTRLLGANNAGCSSGIGLSGNFVRTGYKQRTFASPFEVNTPDY